MKYQEIEKILQKNNFEECDDLRKVIIVSDVICEIKKGIIPSEKFSIFCEAIDRFSFVRQDIILVRSFLEDIMTHGPIWKDLGDKCVVKKLTWDNLLDPENAWYISFLLKSYLKRAYY